MQTFNEFLKSIFSILIIIAIAGGVLIFLMLIASLILGGQQGEVLAVSANQVYMPYFIKAAAIAVLAGLISLYVSGAHVLSLDEED